MEKEQIKQSAWVKESHFYYMLDEMSKQLTEQVKKDNNKAFVLLAFEELENGEFSFPAATAGLPSTIAAIILLFLDQNPKLKVALADAVDKMHSKTEQYENRKNKE